MSDDLGNERFRATFTGGNVSSLGYRVKIDAEMLVDKPYGFVIFTDSIPTNLHHS